MDLDHIASQIKHNCNISDAGYWGYYSPCGLLLRVRDLFKSEQGIKPWENVRSVEIGDWIEKRESLWEELSDHDFMKVEISGKRYRPFDLKGINSVLLHEGLLYGAGYGNLLKPTFFLAEISRKEKRGAYNIYVTVREIVRDLSTAPSMLQGNTIIIRHEIMKLLLWEKFEEMKSIKHESNLSRAFSEYGISKKSAVSLSSEEIDSAITDIAGEELPSYIHHEIGEASQRRLLGKWWKELILKLPYSRAEMFVRGLKDILSDTCNSGMLTHIIKNKKAGSLAFHIALLGGFRKLFFPEIITAYGEFRRSGDWAVIEEARVAGYKKTRVITDALKNMVMEGRVSPERIEEELIAKMSDCSASN